MDPKGVAKRSNGRWARNKQTADYLGVSTMTLWRWKKSAKLNFPAAAVVILSNRHHFKVMPAPR